MGDATAPGRRRAAPVPSHGHRRAHRRSLRHRAKGSVPADALATHRARSAPRLGPGRRAGGTGPRDPARAAVPRRRQPGWEPAGQRVAPRRSADVDGGAGRPRDPHRRRRAARRVRGAGHPRAPRAGLGRDLRGDGGRHHPRLPGLAVIPAAVLTRPGRRVSVAALGRVFLRSMFLQAAWNPRGMQNLGFADAITPALAELYPDRVERAKAVARHLEFFNCHPYLAAAILGGAVRLEERVANGEAPPQIVSSFKSALGPPFAALGDGFFWLALRPVAALAAAATQPFLGMSSVLLFLVLYNAVHLPVRVWLFATGHLRAEGVVDAVARAHMSSGTPFLKAWGAAP